MPSKFGWETWSERVARLKAAEEAAQRAYHDAQRRQAASQAAAAQEKRDAREERMRPIRETAAAADALITELLNDYAKCHGLASTAARSDLGDRIRWSLWLGEERGMVYVTAGAHELAVSSNLPSAAPAAGEIAVALNGCSDYPIAIVRGSDATVLPKA